MSASFDHGRPLTVGVLLCNLGSPDAPETAAVEVSFFFPGMNIFAR